MRCVFAARSGQPVAYGTWIHVALVEFQPKAPQHLHPALQRCLCHGKLWSTTHRTGPLRSAWRLRRLCPCCRWRRKKVQINHQLPNIFNISFHTAALQLSQRDQPFPSLQSVSLWAVPAAPCATLPAIHTAGTSLNPAVETGHGAAQPGLSPLELPLQCPLEGQHSGEAGLRTATPSVP